MNKFVVINGMTVKEVSQKYGTSSTTIYNHIKKNKIENIYRIGKMWLIPQDYVFVPGKRGRSKKNETTQR